MEFYRGVDTNICAECGAHSKPVDEHKGQESLLYDLGCLIVELVSGKIEYCID